MRRAITIQKAMVTTTMATTTATSTPTTVTAINGPTPGPEPIEPASLFPTAECPCPHLRYAGPSVLPVDRIRNFSIISHVDPVGPDPRADRGGRSPAHARAVPRLDGHRA